MIIDQSPHAANCVSLDRQIHEHHPSRVARFQPKVLVGHYGK
jgi:hypothetical protein